MVASSGTASQTSTIQRLPAILFVVGAVLLAVSIPLAWADVRSGPNVELHTVFVYQENPISIFVVLLALPTVPMLYRRWYAAGPRVLAVAATLLVVVGQGASYIDVNAQAVVMREAPVFHAGYYLAAVALIPFVLGTILAFRLGDD